MRRFETEGKREIYRRPASTSTTATTAITVTKVGAVVMHAGPLRYKPATIRKLLEEDTKGVGNSVVDTRILAREGVTSLVRYMNNREIEDGQEAFPHMTGSS